jgi:hypothetical protein
MGVMSHYMSQKILDSMFNAQAFPAPSSLWFALYNSDPAAGNTGVEVSGLGYKRVRVPSMAYAKLSNGLMTVTNSAQVILPRAEGSWTTANYWALFDAQTGGNLIVKERLRVTTAVTNGQQPEFDIGALIVTLE